MLPAQREHDLESGLVYIRARMYDPKLGRFIQTDPPIGRRAAHHYTYAGNTPVSATDPDGEEIRFSKGGKGKSEYFAWLEGLRETGYTGDLLRHVAFDSTTGKVFLARRGSLDLNKLTLDELAVWRAIETQDATYNPASEAGYMSSVQSDFGKWWAPLYSEQLTMLFGESIVLEDWAELRDAEAVISKHASSIKNAETFYSTLAAHNALQGGPFGRYMLRATLAGAPRQGVIGTGGRVLGWAAGKVVARVMAARAAAIAGRTTGGGSKLADMVPGIPDEAFVNFGRTSRPEVAPPTGKSYWWKWKDVKNLTPSQLEGLVGPMASAGEQGGARVVRIADTSAMIMRESTENIAGVTEYAATGAVRVRSVPLGGGE